MLRRFLESLKRHCMMVFLLSVVVGISGLIGCVICWGIINPGVVTNGAIAMMVMAGVGTGMLFFSLAFGLFGDQIMSFVQMLDVFIQKMSNRIICFINYIYEWKEKKRERSSRPKLENIIIRWLEEQDLKTWEKEEKEENKQPILETLACKLQK